MFVFSLAGRKFLMVNYVVGFAKLLYTLAPPLSLGTALQSYLRGCLPDLSPQQVHLNKTFLDLWVVHIFHSTVNRFGPVSPRADSV